MRRAFLILLILMLSTCACSRRNSQGNLSPDAPPDAVPDLEGGYVVNGFDPLGTEYSGVLTIFRSDTPGVYTMQWIVVGSIQQGRGVLEDNTLIVQWNSLAGFGENVHGTATYTITVNRELYGTRFVDGLVGEGIETAYPNQ